MERYERRFTNTVLVWGSGLVLGVLFGLIILGWWLFPVVWVDAAPSDLLYNYQVETLRTTIEAYGYNSDVASAQARYESLGKNKETALAEIVQNPGSLPTTLIDSFATEVAGLQPSALATQTVQQPRTNTGLNTWVAIIAALLFIVVGVLLTMLILRGREKKDTGVYAEEAASLVGPPTEEYAAPVETRAEVIEPVEEEEAVVETFPGESLDLESAAETLEPTPAESGLDLPPFLAAAGLAAAGAAAAESEPVAESEVEKIPPEDMLIVDRAAEEIELPEAELEDFPFEELEPEAEPVTPEASEIETGESTPGMMDSPLGGAGTAFAATALAASELFEEQAPEATGEVGEIEIPVEPVLETPELLGEEIEKPVEGMFVESVPLVTEEEQVVQAADPVEIKMRKRLDFIEGIGPIYAQKLADVGIETTGKLLVEGVSRKGRKDIAEKSGISERLILKWINHVDLFRIKGVGSEYADLLEASGVDTIPELAQRRADHLHQAMLAVNEQKRLVRQLPTEQQVADWIEQARELPRIIQY